MKKDFLVTTGLIDTWEFYENNFILGKWCEFYEFDFIDKETFKEKIPEKINIIKNIDNEEGNEKKVKNHEYLKKKIEYLLEIISEKLSIVHNVSEDKDYWRVIVYTWLCEYVPIIYDRWKSIRVFFEKNKTKKFYSNFISFVDLNYIPKNHVNFIANSQKDEWNHLIFLRLLRFLNFQNLSLVEKKVTKNSLKNGASSLTHMRKRKLRQHENTPLLFRVLNLINNNNMMSKFVFKFNKIIFDSFYFPTKEYLKICLRCKLIPNKHLNFFDFDIKKNSLSKENKRVLFRNLLLKIENQDKFIQFLLLNLHKDMPESYLENFEEIKKKLLPFSKKKKIIFSMHSMFDNDNFKIYIAETKKFGSKYIYSPHGGGLTFKTDPRFNFFEKVSDKIISWGNTENKQNIFVNLSPTLPIVKLKNSRIGDDCSIVFWEEQKYMYKFLNGPGLDKTINLFNEITQFVNRLSPEIKSRVKFRVKENLYGYNFEKRFSEMFGKKYIDKISFKNNFRNTISNSKLIIVTYAQTAFSEAMYSNVPTILMIKKEDWLLSKTSLRMFDDFKKSQIAFENFDEVRTHINKHWKELDLWWKSEKVQSTRRRFLTNFFNIKSDWFKEWSDYIHFSKKL